MENESSINTLVDENRTGRIGTMYIYAEETVDGTETANSVMFAEFGVKPINSFKS
jgi:hypothetical protein